MKVLVSGATGLVGTRLTEVLEEAGHTVVPLARFPEDEPGTHVFWSPRHGVLETADLKGVEAVVHLAGDNIAAGRWTPEKKDRIRDSRVQGTRLLCECLASMEKPPKVLVSASAIGYYGSRGEDLLREESAPGTDFLANVCKAWEAATLPAAKAGIRVVHARLGVVLSPKGGALSKMLLPFQLGGGGILGDGTQWMSWVDLDDVAGALAYAIEHEEITGPMNVVSPNPVTNQTFTQTLGQVLKRPTLAPPAPKLALRLLLGEMADALLLASTRVEPAKLVAHGYSFKYPSLAESLSHQL